MLLVVSAAPTFCGQWVLPVCGHVCSRMKASRELAAPCLDIKQVLHLRTVPEEFSLELWIQSMTNLSAVADSQPFPGQTDSLPPPQTLADNKSTSPTLWG